MARAVISDPKRDTAREPLYDIDAQTGASVEIFYADRAVATAFGTSDIGWFWWTCRAGSLPDKLPTGPFANSYLAYRNSRVAAPLLEIDSQLSVGSPDDFTSLDGLPRQAKHKR